jgi:(S)-mandelate dehydrogenase
MSRGAGLLSLNTADLNAGARMRSSRLFTVEHLRQAARSRLPKMVFEFVDGGSGSENTLMRNRTALDEVRLLPRMLRDVRDANIRTILWGHEYSAPIAVAPMGLCNLVAHGSDTALAKAAADAGIPYTLSTAATTPIETIAAAARRNLWFQLYVTSEEKVTFDLVRRAEEAGVGVLVVTLDIQTSAKRVRDLVNGLSLPMRPTLRTVANLAMHPAWLIGSLRHGAPRFEMLSAYFPERGGAIPHAAMTAKLLATDLLDWTTIGRLRERWPGKLILKGILHPEDAVRAASLGVDGAVISNHGGRQSDAVPASIEMLPEVRQAVGRKLSLLIDSGFRSGEDIVKAIALGADMVLLGRSFLYGIGALGIDKGPARTMAILQDEIRTNLMLLGCKTLDELRSSHTWWSAAACSTRKRSSYVSHNNNGATVASPDAV